MYRSVRLSGCGYKIDFTVNCTGSDVESSIIIPFMHEITKLEIKHVTSAGNNSFSELNYSLKKSTPNNLLMELYRFDDCVQSDIYDEYSNFLHERCQYFLTSNSINTDKIYVSFYIKYTGIQ